jgi:dipeptidyl aminopeptidase/acylaminoacyl peptidase
MSTTRDLELALRATLDERADRTVVDGQLDAILDLVERRPQRPAWQASLRSISMTAQTLRLPRLAASPAWRMLAIASLLLILILAALLAVGGRPIGPPTNGRIVFGRFDPVQDDTVLYTVNPDGTHLLKLRSETHECPFWSPDSKRITTTDAVMNGDGTGFHTLAIPNGPLFVGCGVWSPDGKRIVAEGWADNDQSQVGLYSIRSADGGDLRRLTTATIGHDIPIGFAPDGSSIALMRENVDENSGNRLFLADPDGSDLRPIGDLRIGSGDWAPDGRSILVTSAGRLYSVDVATGTSTPHFIQGNRTANLGNPQWSPDGTRILFNMRVGTAPADFYTMRPDGTDLVRVTSDPDQNYFADWGTYPLDR